MWNYFNNIMQIVLDKIYNRSPNTTTHKPELIPLYFSYICGLPFSGLRDDYQITECATNELVLANGHLYVFAFYFTLDGLLFIILRE